MKIKGLNELNLILELLKIDLTEGIIHDYVKSIKCSTSFSKYKLIKNLIEEGIFQFKDIKIVGKREFNVYKFDQDKLFKVFIEDTEIGKKFDEAYVNNNYIVVDRIFPNFKKKSY